MLAVLVVQVVVEVERLGGVVAHLRQRFAIGHIVIGTQTCGVGPKRVQLVRLDTLNPTLGTKLLEIDEMT